MSPSVGNFVHDLVEMAKAMETLPQVQAELERMQEQSAEDGHRIARLEAKLIDRANEINDLNAKIRSLEVERDDASFRELEAQDKVATVLREVGDMQAVLRRIEVTIVPPKPEPTPEPVLPPAVDITDERQVPGYESSFTPAPTPTASPEVVGESVTDPTVSSHPSGESGTGSVGQSSPNAEPTLGTGYPDIVSRPVDQPYLGKHYIDIPRYVSYTDWVAGGGTYDGY